MKQGMSIDGFACLSVLHSIPFFHLKTPLVQAELVFVSNPFLVSKCILPHKNVPFTQKSAYYSPIRKGDNLTYRTIDL